MATGATCAKCGRPMGDQVQRCLYCGTRRILAAPGTPEFEVEKKAAEEDAKRTERQKALYAHGVGLGKKSKPSFAERMQNESLPIRLAVGLLAIPLLVIWPPWAVKWLKTLFQS